MPPPQTATAAVVIEEAASQPKKPQQEEALLLGAFESLSALESMVPAYLLGQVTLEQLNACTTALALAFRSHAELSTDDATEAIAAHAGTALAASAKTVLLILQKAGHIRMVFNGSTTSWALCS